MDFRRWSDAVVLGGSHLISGRGRGSLAQTWQEIESFFSVHVARILDGSIEGGILRTFLRSDQGDGLSQEEVRTIAKILMVAGSETTTNLLGNAIVALLANPECLEACVADGSHIPSAVEEVLRYDSPVQYVQRIARGEQSLAGVALPPGSRIFAFIGSANRDERRFPDPDRFDPTRKTKGHLAFGFGAHHCLGSGLARLEARVALDLLFRHLPRPRLAANPVSLPRIETLELRGFRRLDIHFSGKG